MQLVPWTRAGLTSLGGFTAQQILLVLIHNISCSHDVSLQRFLNDPHHVHRVNCELIQVIHVLFYAEMMQLYPSAATDEWTIRGPTSVFSWPIEKERKQCNLMPAAGL
jgi:hypothetical protein